MTDHNQNPELTGVVVPMIMPLDQRVEIDTSAEAHRQVSGLQADDELLESQVLA